MPQVAASHVLMLHTMAANLTAAVSQRGADVAPDAHMMQQQLACLAGRLLHASPAPAVTSLQQHFLQVAHATGAYA